MMSTTILFLFTILIFYPGNEHRADALALNGKCGVDHEERFYSEGEAVIIGKKIYKVEDCQLQRAYQACGAPLWYMINVVCQSVEKQKSRTSTLASMTSSPSTAAGVKYRPRRFLRETLLTDSCCERPCTISEMTRYCPY